MKRTLAYASLLLLSLLTACPKRQVNPGPSRADYDAVRQRADEAHKSLDQEKGP